MKKRKLVIAISDNDRWKFGCPYCSYKEAKLLQRKTDMQKGGTGALLRCYKCEGRYVVLSGKLKVSPFTFRSGGIQYNPHLQAHPKRKKELKKAVRKVMKELREE